MTRIANNKWYLLIFAAFMVAGMFYSGRLTAQPDSLVIGANNSYNAEQYPDAIEKYRAVIDQGYVSPELFYNLGNSYFKLGRIPEAILYYEKALKLEPGNEDIRYNLQLANSRITDKIEPVPELFLRTWWKQLRDRLPVDSWAWASIAGFLLVLFFTGIVVLSRSSRLKRFSFWTGVVILLFSILATTLASQSLKEITNQEEAIIFTPTVTVKSSPNKGSVDLFVIHEGTKVHITDKVEGWSEIRIADGNKGWVTDDTYRSI